MRKYETRFFFWLQSEGESNSGWCIPGRNHFHLLKKGLCNQKNEP
jgi:hypothetical protein